MWVHRVGRPNTVSPISGEFVGAFEDYDQLVESLRTRAASLGLPYRVLDELTGLGEGNAGKYLPDLRSKQFTVSSLLAITRTLGIKGCFFVDPALVAEMAPLYEKRDPQKAHARRRALLGPVTLRRVLPAAAAEMGRRGAASRNRRLGPEVRRALAVAAARARWQGKPDGPSDDYG